MQELKLHIKGQVSHHKEKQIENIISPKKKINIDLVGELSNTEGHLNLFELKLVAMITCTVYISKKYY